MISKEFIKDMNIFIGIYRKEGIIEKSSMSINSDGGIFISITPKDKEKMIELFKESESIYWEKLEPEKALEGAINSLDIVLNKKYVVKVESI